MFQGNESPQKINKTFFHGQFLSVRQVCREHFKRDSVCVKYSQLKRKTHCIVGMFSVCMYVSMYLLVCVSVCLPLDPRAPESSENHIDADDFKGNGR